jgi:hypothetical protein
MVFIDRKMELAPDPTNRKSMPLCVPFVFAVDLKPCAINDDGHTRIEFLTQEARGYRSAALGLLMVTS